MWDYRAKLVRVIDGDTIDVDIDLGFSCTIRERLRLLGINAPELRKDDQAGYLAKDHLLTLLSKSDDLRVRTVKDKQEKYGRFLATIHVGDLNVNNQMILDGFAAEATYGCELV